MDREKLAKALSDFYCIIEKYPQGPANKKEYILSPENFILFGGGSLVVQQKLPETSDLDLIVRQKDNFYHLTRALQRIIPVTFAAAEGKIFLKKDIAEFSLSDKEFDLFREDAALFFLDGDIYKAQRTDINGTTVYFRPDELIIKDYEKTLRMIKSSPVSGSVDAQELIRKYAQRLELLRSHRTVASL